MEDCSIDQLFIVDTIQVFPYKDEESLVYSRRKNIKITLDYLDVENALACKQFLPIDEHIDNIYQELSEYKQDKKAIKESLNNLIEVGLLVSPREIIHELKKSYKPVEPSNSWENGWVLAICSADRPKLVKRLLSTVTQHILALPVKPLILMIDDSRTKEFSEQNYQNIKNYCYESDIRYEYWNRDKRCQYSQLLVKELPKCNSSINYLLSPDFHSDSANTIGQARNFAILRSSGKPLLMLDDDSLINPLQEGNYHHSVKFGYSGKKAIVKASYDELFVNFDTSSVNPLLAHLDVLGSPASVRVLDSLAEMEEPEYWKGNTQEILLELERDSFIGLSVNAIIGALNSRQMDWFYSLGKGDVVGAANLLESLDDDVNLSIPQATWNGRAHDEMSRKIPFIGTTICGISALPMVPPMPPTGRNEDLSLGATISFLYKKSQVYQFGWGLPHLPQPFRQWQPFKEQQEPEFNSTSYYISLLSWLEKHCLLSEPKERLEYLVEFLSEWSEEQINSLLKDSIYWDLSHSINKVRKSAEQASTFPKYQQGCLKMLNYYQNEMENINEQLPKLQEDMKLFSETFSEALNDWPAIWKHSKKNKWIFTND